MAQLNVEVRVPAKIANGSFPAARGDSFGNLVVQQAGGKYRDVVLQGNVHHASNTSDVTIGTALTATGVTFHLYNAASSGKNAVILEVAFAEATVTVTAGNVLIGINPTTTQAAPTTTTALTVRNNLVGTGGLTNDATTIAAYSAATIAAAPVAALQIGIVNTAVGVHDAIRHATDGLLILIPGTVLSIQGVTVSLVGRASACWEEVAV